MRTKISLGCSTCLKVFPTIRAHLKPPRGSNKIITIIIICYILYCHYRKEKFYNLLLKKWSVIEFGKKNFIKINLFIFEESFERNSFIFSSFYLTFKLINKDLKNRIRSLFVDSLSFHL